MSNKIDKPKQTAPQLITKMKSKGITFKYITEEKAAEYLTDKNTLYPVLKIHFLYYQPTSQYAECHKVFLIVPFSLLCPL